MTPKKSTHLGLTVRRFKLADVAEHPENPRIHPPAGTPEWEALRKSLEESYFDPLVLNVRGGKKVLVSGHYRRKVMLEMGVRSADMVVVDWDEPTHRARMLAANELLGRFDDAKLRELLNSVQAGETEQDLTGLTAERLAELIGQCTPETPENDVDAEPQIDKAEELRVKFGVERGQVWQCGDHRLMCGDATLREDVNRLVIPDIVSSVLTDPPYGQNQEGVPNDEPEKLSELISGTVAALPITNGIIAAFQSPRTFPVWLDATRRHGFEFERMLWMYKAAQCTFPWRGWILKSESILLSSVGKPNWNDVHPFSHDCYYLPEVSGELPEGSGWHGSVKPLKVVTDLASRICQEGDIVYDPFLGSGTTLIACERLNRRCRAMEISPQYVAVALDRWATATGKTPVRL